MHLYLKFERKILKIGKFIADLIEFHVHHAHPHACMFTKKMRSVPHIYTTCLFILKRFRLHILSRFMRTLADKKVESRKNRIITRFILVSKQNGRAFRPFIN